jgi:penicillin-binding protein 2
MAYDFHSETFGSRPRRRIFYATMLAIAALYVLRLVQLQIVEGSQYLAKTEMQAIKPIITDPVRGAVYDRNGTMIIHNIPAFSVSITPSEFDTSTIDFLARLLNIDRAELKDKIQRYRKISPTTAVKVFRDVSDSVIAAIEENRDLLPGVSIAPESKRLYDYVGNSPHIFGYTKEINDRQLETMGDYYRPGDMIGWSGLEASFENFLRGTKGVEYNAVDVKGRFVADFNDGKNDIQPEDGFDLVLGIDVRLQQYVDSLMNDKRGAAVAIDPQTGEILALISKPDYDPRIFSGRTSPEVFAALQNDTLKPQFNRATQTNYPPGSTWKMLMGLAGLQEGIIDESSTFTCHGTFTFGNRTFKCHGGTHGAINLRRALQVSCNSYFYQLALKLGVKKFTHYGQMFGFGTKSNLDIEENAGLIPSEEYMNRRKGKNGWGEGSLVNWGIGQGEIGVNPLQMASYTATLANKGIWRQPHVVRAVVNKKLHTMQPVEYATRRVPIDSQYYEIIHQGMFDVVNTPGGTAFKDLGRDGNNICGKTGTAQNPHGKDHSWFVCFAPRDKPVIAVCVMVENAGFGATVAAPIAQKIVQRYRALQNLPPQHLPSDSLRTVPAQGQNKTIAQAQE